MATVVISAYNVANTPHFGGHFWVYLQYAHGLRRLGCEVYWLERLRRDERHPTASAVPTTFFRRMEHYGFADRALLYEADNGDGRLRFIGMSETASRVPIQHRDARIARRQPVRVTRQSFEEDANAAAR